MGHYDFCVFSKLLQTYIIFTLAFKKKTIDTKNNVILRKLGWVIKKQTMKQIEGFWFLQPEIFSLNKLVFSVVGLHTQDIRGFVLRKQRSISSNLRKQTWRVTHSTILSLAELNSESKWTYFLSCLSHFLRNGGS